MSSYFVNSLAKCYGGPGSGTGNPNEAPAPRATPTGEGGETGPGEEHEGRSIAPAQTEYAVGSGHHQRHHQQVVATDARYGTYSADCLAKFRGGGVGTVDEEEKRAIHPTNGDYYTLSTPSERFVNRRVTQHPMPGYPLQGYGYTPGAAAAQCAYRVEQGSAGDDRSPLRSDESSGSSPRQQRVSTSGVSSGIKIAGAIPASAASPPSAVRPEVWMKADRKSPLEATTTTTAMMKDGDNMSEESQSSGEELEIPPSGSAPQIYPWMRRAHTGRGLYSIAHSLADSFVHSIAHSFAHLLFLLIAHSLAHKFPHSNVHSLAHSFAHSHAHSFLATHLFIRLLTRLPTHLLFQLLTRWFIVHSIYHSLAESPAQSLAYLIGHLFSHSFSHAVAH